MTYGSLFTGIGGLDLAVESHGFGPCVWQAEQNEFCRAVLATRWPGVTCHKDVRDVDSTRPPPELVCGGFPCTDISVAGKGAGIEGPQSGLWSEYARVVRVLRPALVFVENVAALTVRGLDRVLGDLAALGYDADWTCIRASDAGAPHLRERIFILAHAHRRGIRILAERRTRRRRRTGATERGNAEPMVAGSELADSDCAVERRTGHAGASDHSAEEAQSRLHEPAGHGDVANPDRGGSRTREHGVREGESYADGGGPLADADVAGRGRSTRDAVQGVSAATIESGTSQPGGLGGGALADAHGRGRGARSERSAIQEGRTFPDGRGFDDYVHRFPPGPAGIAGWDGPQPAIRRGDDGSARRLDRAALRALGNAVVWQQAAQALEELMTAALRGRRAA